MSNVIAALAWPSIFWTALTFAPADTARLAAVCRRSCGVARGARDSATALANHPDVGCARFQVPTVVAGEQQVAAFPPLALAGQVGQQELWQGHGALFVGLGGADEYPRAGLDGVLRHDFRHLFAAG